MGRWRKAFGAALLVTLVATAAACGDDDDDTTATTEPGGTTTAATEAITELAIGEVLAPPTLDITTGSGAAIPQALLYNLYETLVKIDDAGEIQPLLAETYDVSDDGLTYTFTLRDGVTFHNGEPFTSEDVVFSFDRARNLETAPGLIKATFAPVDTVEAPDDTTVVVTLKQPSRDFLFNIAQTGGVIIEESAVPDLATKPIGTGPFTFDAYVTNSSLSMTRNPDYWGDAPGMEKVTFRYFADANALANAMKAGDINIIDNITPELFPQFEQDTANYETVKGTTNGETIIAFNNSKAPLDDVRVRQAISYAINKDDINEVAESGYGTIIGSHASTNDPWYIDLSDTYPFDPDKAKELLAEAGQSDLKLTMKVPPTPYAKAISQAAVSQLKDVGVELTLVDVDFPKWIEEVFTNADYDLTVISHVEARDINQYGNPQYYWRYDDAETQKLLKDADAEVDEAKSNDIYAQVQRRINEQAVNDWLYLLPRLQVVKKGLTGYPENSRSLSYDVTGITAA